MRRTWWFRPLATILTLWLPLIIGEPSMLQPCPTHGSVVVASAAIKTAASSAAGHHAGVASHAGHHIGSAPASGHDSSPGHQHNCSCIGCCAGSAAVVQTFDAPIASVVVATYTAAAAPVEAAALPRPAPEFARPYTTGPPRA
jgi:hypothetical protein